MKSYNFFEKLKHFVFHNSRMILPLLFLALSVTTAVLASNSTPFYPTDNTIDPNCAPGETNCYVSTFPDQTGNSGKVLTTDGTNVSWGTPTVPSDTSLTYTTDNISLKAALDSILHPYVSPTFSSFSISGQSTSVEVGTTISGSKSFIWGFNNSGNVSPNTMNIVDVTGSTNLATNISITSPHSSSVGTVQLNSPGSYSWKGSATNTNSVVFNSSNFTVSWQWKRYIGTSTSVTLDQTAIKALATSALASNQNGSFVFSASGGTYKYFAYPDSFGSPTATTGFKDSSTNLAVAMADSSDDAFYSNTENGWSYGTVSVTNSQSVTTTYRVYRTKNSLGGAITIVVS